MPRYYSRGSIDLLKFGTDRGDCKRNCQKRGINKKWENRFGMNELMVSNLLVFLCNISSAIKCSNFPFRKDFNQQMPIRSFALKAFNVKRLTISTGKCSEKEVLWNKRVQKAVAKFLDFTKSNSLRSTFEEARSQFLLTLVMTT